MQKLPTYLCVLYLSFSANARELKPTDVSSYVGAGRSTLYCAQNLALKIIESLPETKGKSITIKAVTTVFGKTRSDNRETGLSNVRLVGSIAGVPFEGDMTLTFYNKFDSNHKVSASRCHVETERLESEHVFEIRNKEDQRVIVAGTYDKDQCPIRRPEMVDNLLSEIKLILGRLN